MLKTKIIRHLREITNKTEGQLGDRTDRTYKQIIIINIGYAMKQRCIHDLEHCGNQCLDVPSTQREAV